MKRIKALSMKSIKVKILLASCITAAVIILGLAVLISFKLGSSIRVQSQILSQELTAMSNTTLSGYHGMLRSAYDRVLEDIHGLLVSVTYEGYKAQTDKIDFTILFNLQGEYISSTPINIWDEAAITWLEEYYRSSPLGGKIAKAIKTPEKELPPELLQVQSVNTVGVDFIKALQLKPEAFPGNAFIVMQAVKILRDIANSPLAVVVAGKIVNHHERPFEDFYKTSGLPCAVYLDTDAVVQAGFIGKGKEADNQRIALSPDTLAQIYGTAKTTTLALPLAGKVYQAVCSPLLDDYGRKIGALMVSMPQQVINEINRRVANHGQAEKSRMQMWLLSFGIVALAVLIISSMSIANQVADPVLKVVDLANAIAAGDLTQRLDMSRDDEIGQMATALDNSCKDLSGMIARIRDHSNIVASAAEEMTAVSSQMAASSEEMSTQSITVAGATEEMSASIGSMASAAEEMSVNIQSVSSTTEQMSQNMDAVAAAIEEMSVSIKDVAASAQAGSDTTAKAEAMSVSATKTMKGLDAAAQEIGKVTDLIKRIADQTNLLALNATIEAASAGDAGKGFAVVANEIKELARQSAQAAEDIAKRIDGVQVNTKEATEVIAQIATIINQVNESSLVITKSVEQQMNTSNEISGNVHQASTGVNHIASAIAEIARGASDVSKSAAETARGVNEVSASIQGVSQAAKDSNVGAHQVSTSAAELAKMASEIRHMVGTFKVESENRGKAVKKKI